MRHNDQEPSLFDPIIETLKKVSRWREVPQPLFDSWSVPMQLVYCATRDEDSAATTYDPEWAEFYAARAALYREMIDAR